MSKPVDLTNLEEIINGNAEIRKKLFDQFISGAEKCLPVLEQLCGNFDEATWRSKSHAMKGLALNIGANNLAAKCKSAQENTPPTAETRRKLMDEIKAEYDLVKKFLQDELTKPIK